MDRSFRRMIWFGALFAALFAAQAFVALPWAHAVVSEGIIDADEEGGDGIEDVGDDGDEGERHSTEN